MMSHLSALGGRKCAPHRHVVSIRQSLIVYFENIVTFPSAPNSASSAFNLRSNRLFRVRTKERRAYILNKNKRYNRAYVRFKINTKKGRREKTITLLVHRELHFTDPKKAFFNTLLYLRTSFFTFSKALRVFEIKQLDYSDWRATTVEHAFRQSDASQSSLRREHAIGRGHPMYERISFHLHPFLLFLLFFIRHPLFLILSSRKLVPLPLFLRHFGGPSVATRRT